jgi:hypothetical protein
MFARIKTSSVIKPNFFEKEKPGKFLYCETSSELQTNLNKIIEENRWWRWWKSN